MSKFRFKAAPLPAHFRGNLQEFLDAFLDRMEITSDAETFTISDDEPAGNRGPWFKEGTQLFVWNEETSDYDGIDLSASYTAQVWIGATEPDSTIYKIWLKLSGTAVVGLFTFFEDDQVWRTKDLTIQPGSITTNLLMDNVGTSIKFRALSITIAKLASVIPINKWQKGQPGQMVRMDYEGTVSDWSDVLKVSEELAVSSESIIHWSHGLDRAPFIIRAFFVCKLDDAGWTAGTEIDYRGIGTYFDAVGPKRGGLPSMSKNSDTIDMQIGLSLSVKHPVDQISRYINPGKWRLKYYLWAQ